MKKVLGLTMLTLFFTCCEVGVKNVSAEKPVTGSAGGGNGRVYAECAHAHGMDYDIYHTWSGVYVVNITKEKLEVELLQLQIDSLKNY